MYTYDQVYSATLAYFKGNELATNVWVGKYALKGADGLYLELTPDDMHKRLATAFAAVEANTTCKPHPDKSDYGNTRQPLTHADIYTLFEQFANVIPQGSIMAVAGDTNYIGSLSNCVVVESPHDSYGGIMHTDQQLAQLMKRRCGAGVDISTLRPSGMNVSNVAKQSTGATSFMHRFSNTTREVAQGGRRGALMLTMHCAHPDIIDFITIKQDLTKVTGANISVMWSDEFMTAVANDTPFTLRWPVHLPPEQARYTKVVSARAVWDLAVANAHANAEPGMIFIDTMKSYSTCDPYAPILSTNPCSELAMASDSCRLIANNMFGSVRNPYTNDAYFDHAHWYKVCYEAQVLGDDLVTLELEYVQRIIDKIDSDTEPEYIKAVERQMWVALQAAGYNWRRTGGGFTAYGDTLAALGYTYGAAPSITDAIMLTKLQAEWDATTDMAIDRGAFPDWYEKGHLPTPFTTYLSVAHPTAYARMLKHGRRNISLSTVAPTGSLSMLAKLKTHFGTTSGIEPLFAPWYTRRKKVNPDDTTIPVTFVDDTGDAWAEFPVFHNGLLEWADANGIPHVAIENEYHLSPYSDCCACDIDWAARVATQATIQRYITHSISSTINLPRTTPVSTVNEIYTTAYKQGLKGITVYVDGARDGVLITSPKQQPLIKNDAPKRPKNLPCTITPVKWYGDWLVIVGYLATAPFEVFAMKHPPITDTTGTLVKMGNGRYDLVLASETIEDITRDYDGQNEESLTRLISAALRHGMDIKHIVEQLGKSRGTVTSFAKVIYRTLSALLPPDTQLKLKCGQCGSTNLVFEEGCSKCTDCGYSGCG